MVKLLIVIPSNTQRMTYPIPFVNSLIKNLLNIPKDFQVEIQNIGGLRIDMVRLQAVKYAQDHHFDLLCMLDDDMQFPDDAIVKLLNHWHEEEMLVVCGNYHTRYPPFNSMIWPLGSSEWLMFYEKKVYEVQTLATGCILIDMRVFDTIEKPYFLLRMDCDGRLVGTEDCYFGTNCVNHGIKIYCDASIECEHFFYDSYPHYFQNPAITRAGEQTFEKYMGWGNIDKIMPKIDPDLIQLGMQQNPVEGIDNIQGVMKCKHDHQIQIDDTHVKCKDCEEIQQIGGNI